MAEPPASSSRAASRALAAGIRDVLADPALADRLAHAAFDEVANYTWAHRAARIERLLAEVVGAS